MGVTIHFEGQVTSEAAIDAATRAPEEDRTSGLGLGFDRGAISHSQSKLDRPVQRHCDSDSVPEKPVL